MRAVSVWVEERDSLSERLRKAETDTETAKQAATDALNLVERLKPGAESGLKEALAAAHARLAVLQARETRLSRALESSTAKVRIVFPKSRTTVCPYKTDTFFYLSQELRMKKERDALDFDIKEMSKAARERLAFHEERADLADAKARRARRELEQSVPKDEHARVVDDAKALQQRHKELLESRLESSVAATKLAAAEEDAKAALSSAETATAAAFVAEARASAFEQALEKCLKDAKHPSELELVALRKEAAELEAKLEGTDLAFPNPDTVYCPWWSTLLVTFTSTGNYYIHHK